MVMIPNGGTRKGVRWSTTTTTNTTPTPTSTP